MEESTMGSEKVEKAFYTIKEPMDRWQVARQTIYNEIDRGRLKRQHIAGSVRFSVAEVERYERTA
jgi:hypothetical protein